MSICRKPYPSDVSDEEWSLVAPYLLLQPEDAGQREHDLREVFNGLRYIVKTGAPWRWMPNDLPPWAKQPKVPAMRSIVGMAAEGAVYQQTQRWLAAGCFEALVDDLRAVLRLAAGRKAEPAAAIIDSRTLRSTPESGERAANAAAKHGIALEVVKLPEARRGFVLLPRRWVVERSFAWATRFRRLVKDYERYAETLAGLHLVAFACLMMKQAITIVAGS